MNKSATIPIGFKIVRLFRNYFIWLVCGVFLEVFCIVVVVFVLLFVVGFFVISSLQFFLGYFILFFRQQLL